jgi:hypothetical protein
VKPNDGLPLPLTAGDPHVETEESTATITPLILTHNSAIAEFVNMQAAIEKELVAAAKQLPAAEWVEQPEQRGFGAKFLGIVIGETGDLNNYANPGKVWRRLGAAPWTFDGKTRMGSTWRRGKEGKLPSSEWEEFGYSPRRRSIMYLIGEGLMKQNTVGGGAGEGSGEIENCTAGPYRLRYNVKKAELAAAHADDKLYPPIRCHSHGMLLAAKLLVKNLWIEWRA